MTPTCPYCGTTEGLRQHHDDGFHVPDYVCEDCFTSTDDSPCFDDLPEVKAATNFDRRQS